MATTTFSFACVSNLHTDNEYTSFNSKGDVDPAIPQWSEDITPFSPSDVHRNQILRERSLMMKLERSHVNHPLYSKWSDMTYSMKDLFGKDEGCLGRSDGIQFYCTVLIHKGEYYGHVYMWIMADVCMVQGIRARIDAIFMQDRLPNISHYILEGVRRFVIAKGLRGMIIAEPMTHMCKILDKLPMFSGNVSSLWGIYYTNKKLATPIMTGVNFKLI